MLRIPRNIIKEGRGRFGPKYQTRMEFCRGSLLKRAKLFSCTFINAIIYFEIRIRRNVKIFTSPLFVRDGMDGLANEEKIDLPADKKKNRY